MSLDPGDLRPRSLADEAWLAGNVRRVLGILADGGYEGRVVGGAVRNALLGTPVKDVDIATTALPADVIRLAEAAGLGAVPTGVAHGTVTIIADRQPIEVTTLRRDVETFGRQARVSFTKDWREDAERRDFTINALYCDANGAVHDPLGGYGDLLARRVRFIGEARERIREDYLRILRFFRFTAEYASGEPDSDGLAAAIEMAPGMVQLSAERVRAELLRLLKAPRAVEIARVMAEAGFFEALIGTAGDVQALARLAAIEAALGREPDALLRLAALAGVGAGASPSALAERLRLSNAEADRLHQVALPSQALVPSADEKTARAFIYRLGAEAFRDGVLLAWSRSDAAPDCERWRGRFTLPERWTAPALPVRGADLLSRGLAQGPAVGLILRAFEDWWVSEDFPKDEYLLARTLSNIVKASR
ncbi:CCA tRNA nucleotidyltransferase [Hyphomicrobium sp.]|uniref:CCA tRNA nucleotidyltransferase n=1 Tax=Hyphomicrobium sp. TaxID=82 RepID=UPI003F718EE1